VTIGNLQTTVLTVKRSQVTASLVTRNKGLTSSKPNLIGRQTGRDSNAVMTFILDRNGTDSNPVMILVSERIGTDSNPVVSHFGEKWKGM
jgi:hypothetical protein